MALPFKRRLLVWWGNVTVNNFVQLKKMCERGSTEVRLPFITKFNSDSLVISEITGYRLEYMQNQTLSAFYLNSCNSHTSIVKLSLLRRRHWSLPQNLHFSKRIILCWSAHVIDTWLCYSWNSRAISKKKSAVILELNFPESSDRLIPVIVPYAHASTAVGSSPQPPLEDMSFLCWHGTSFSQDVPTGEITSPWSRIMPHILMLHAIFWDQLFGGL